MQLHGGIGVTWEHDLHLYLRRVTVNRVTYGTPEEHRERVAATACCGWSSDERHRGTDETVEEFRARARAWLAEQHAAARRASSHRGGDDGRRDVERELQRRLWAGGFAGSASRPSTAASGLTPEHQRAFTEESLAYDMPFSLNVPTLGILAATLVDFGTHEQKPRHLPAILRGEELWVQFLSEPSGGSDLAGCLTRADRDGDVLVMNGSKIWSSAAFASDYAHVPGPHELGRAQAPRPHDVHRRRSTSPGIQVEQIRQVDGSMEFCQEFFDDVPSRPPTWWARSTTAGRSPRACSSTSATRSAAARPTPAAASAATARDR